MSNRLGKSDKKDLTTFAILMFFNGKVPHVSYFCQLVGTEIAVSWKKESARTALEKGCKWRDRKIPTEPINRVHVQRRVVFIYLAYLHGILPSVYSMSHLNQSLCG